MSKNQIILKWKGPLEVGTFPRNEKEIEHLGLKNPGVYLIVQNFENFSTGYGGQTSDLRQRLHEHLASYMGFKYALRLKNPPLRKDFYRSSKADWSDEYIFWKIKEEGLNCYNYLLDWIPIALMEIKRMQFFYCRYSGDGQIRDIKGECNLLPQEFMKWMEGHLVYHLKNFQGKENKFICDNERFPVANFSQSYSMDYVIENEYLKGQANLKKILGKILKSPKK